MTAYALGQVSAPTTTLDMQTRRHEKHEPRPQVQLFVGKRVVRIELTEAELIRLASDALQALGALRHHRKTESENPA